MPNEGRRGFSRAQGASSGAESYPLGACLCVAVPLAAGWGARGVGLVLVVSFVFQTLVMARIDRQILWHYCLSQKLGPSKMRNASIGFAQCVRPGGRPTEAHALEMYDLSAPVSSMLFLATAVAGVALNPFVAVVRVFYPEHSTGVNRGRRLRLYGFFLRHPVAVQGEGPSNGDGLAAMNAAESLLYPITPRELQRGPEDRPYWREEGRPRLRDMFHDKLFVHRFFRDHGASHPILVAYVEKGRRVRTFVEPADAPAKLIWKPRYSTMGLGVEHFERDGWARERPLADRGEWAPSDEPYIVEELIESTEHACAEWYRMTTVWSKAWARPRSGYNWRMRNKPGDRRVQTDIMGGCYCVASEHAPFVGPTKRGVSFNPRTGEERPLLPAVDRALNRAIALMIRMHETLGQELWHIGWDVLVRDDEPVFIEFNINNGFFVADHSVEECEQMCGFYSREFDARVGEQLVDFDPWAAEREGKKSQ